MKEKFNKFKTYLIAYWAKTQDALSVFWRFSIRKLRVLLLPVQALFGFSVIKQDVKSKSADISNYLSETDQHLLEIPEDYRENFNLASEIERDSYINTHNNLLNIENTIASWQEGFASNVAVVGEKGSGKSTFLRLVEEELVEEDSYVINVKETLWKVDQMLTLIGKSLQLDDFSKPEAVIRGIQNKEKQMVIYLENLQNLYLRNINGFQALEALWLIMSETKHQVFWAVSCSRYAWQFLNKANNIDTHFTHVVSVDGLNTGELKSMILKRHRKSGYELEYEPDEATRKSRAYRKRLDDPKELQNYLEEVYFDRLSDMAEGNSSIAIIFWLRSIKSVEGNKITILPLQAAVIEGMDVLTPEVLFVLASVIMHDTLSVNDLTRLMHFSFMESRVILTKLRSRGILLEQNNSYQLNQLVYRQMLRLLKSRNIIH